VILPAILLALLWGMAIVRFATVFRDARQRALWAALAAVTICKTLAFPPIATALNTPVLPHLFGVLAAYFLFQFVALVTGRGSSRRQAVLVGIVLVVLFVLAVQAEPVSPKVPTRNVAYWVLLEAYLSVVLVNATVLFWETSRQVNAGLPRLALRMMATGTALITAFAAFRIAALVVDELVGVEPAAEQVQTAAVLLTVTGGMLAASPRARAAITAYRSLIMLRPLWTAMRDAFPEIILFTPRRAIVELAGVDDVHLRLYRRVIEIRDGMLALRGHLEPDEETAGETTEDKAFQEAQAIVRALGHREAGKPPYASPREWAPVGPTMADEVAWLSRVSRSYRRARAVRTPRLSGSAR
jgi:hypothetical protein